MSTDNIVLVSNQATAAQEAKLNPKVEAENKVETESAAIEETQDAETLEASDTSETSDESEVEAKADADDDAESADEKDGEELRPKRKSGWQRKVDKLTKRASEHEREAQYWKEQALKSLKTDDQTQVQKEEAKPQVQKSDASKKPTPDNFETHAEYIEALAEFKAQELLDKRDAQAKKEQLEQSVQKQVQTYQERAEKFATENDDFWEVMEDVKHIQMSPVFNEEILENELGPEMLYEIAKDPKEFARIASLPARSILKELGKIEARLSEKPAEEIKPQKQQVTTKAPKPVSPVQKGASGSKKSIYDPNISQADYEKLRREQLRAKSA